MSMEFRVFKAASSGGRLTVAAKVKGVVKRAAEVASPTFESFVAAFRRTPQTREDTLRTNLSAPSTPGKAPTQPKFNAAPTVPDMAAAIRAAAQKRK